MINVRLFGRCRIYHDPVSPVLREPAQVGWDAWYRSIDLVTPQPLKGEELLRRTRGWWTVDPEAVAVLVKAHGKLVVGDQGELMVAVENEQSLSNLRQALADQFGDQIQLAP